MSELKGTKFDEGKAQVDLLSSMWLLGVGQVLTFGAKKYAAHNWRKGLSRSRLMAAAMRHIFSYNSGEDVDPETGLLHLYHASCCLMFASELHFTKPETDDRFKGVLPDQPIPIGDSGRIIETVGVVDISERQKSAYIVYPCVGAQPHQLMQDPLSKEAKCLKCGLRCHQ